MARAFVSASSEYLVINSVPVTGHPFTLACFGYCTQDTALQIGVSIAAVGSFQYHALGFGGATAGDPVIAWTFDGTSAMAETSSGYTTNTWHHLAGVFKATDDRAVFIDGGSKGTNATDKIVPITWDNTAIAVSADSTPFGYFDGRVAEAAIWNVALTDAEIAILATGIRPIYVRPQNLVFYAPLWRDEDEDYVGGLSLTAGGSPTVTAHPPIIWSLPKPWSLPPSVGGEQNYQSAAGVLTPVGIIIKSGRKNLAGSSTLSGIISKATTKTFTGSLTASGILATIKAALKSVSGSLTPSGTLVRQTGKILAGSLTATGSLIKQTVKGFVGSVISVGSLATQKIAGGYFQVVGGAVTMAGILVKQTNKQTAGIITAAGILARQISKAFTGATTAAGSLVRQTAKSFVGSVTAVGTLVSQLTFIQIVSGAVTMAGSLVRMTGKQTAGIITMTGSIAKRISKTFTGALTAVGALARQLLGLPTPYDQTFAIAAENRVYSIPG